MTVLRGLKTLSDAKISSAIVQDDNGDFVGILGMTDVICLLVAKLGVEGLSEKDALMAVSEFHNKKGRTSHWKAAES